MRTIKIKRIWNGIVSLRSDVVESLLRKEESARLELDAKGQYMILSLDDLEHKRFQVNKKPFLSKLGTGIYYLIDYKWVPVEKEKKEVEQDKAQK